MKKDNMLPQEKKLPYKLSCRFAALSFYAACLLLSAGT
jgi:hypothetical protein